MPDFKALKQAIEKQAQEFDPPPRRHSERAPSARQTLDRPHDITNENSVGTNPIAVVKKLQLALISLAQTASSQINVGGLASDRPQEQGEAGSRNSFHNFLTKHFMRTSDVPGVEFDPDHNKTNLSDKKPSQPTRMTSVLDTMARIGSPKTGELTADGRWGPRTNTALHNAYAFGFSMLKLAHAFDLSNLSFDDKQLSEMKSLIPPDEETMPFLKLSAEQMEGAVKLTRLISNLQRMYAEIKHDILEKPEYQTYIEGDTPFAIYKKEVPNFTTQEGQIYSQLSSGNSQANKQYSFFVQALNAPPGTGANSQISLVDLVSADAFSKWYYSPAGNALRGVPPETIFASIRKSLQQAESVQ